MPFALIVAAVIGMAAIATTAPAATPAAMLLTLPHRLSFFPRRFLRAHARRSHPNRGSITSGLITGSKTHRVPSHRRGNMLRSPHYTDQHQRCPCDPLRTAPDLRLQGATHVSITELRWIWQPGRQRRHTLPLTSRACLLAFDPNVDRFGQGTPRALPGN